MNKIIFVIAAVLLHALCAQAGVTRWKQGCSQFGSTYFISYVEFDFDTNRMMFIEDRFTDSACTKKFLNQVETLKFVLAETSNDYKNLDMDAFEGLWAPNTKAYADDMNARKVCKRTDWREGVHNEVVMTNCFANTKTYQIIQFKGNELRFGTPPTNVPEKRPTKLSDRIYFRQP